MKEFKLYQCEFCKTSYASEAEAKKCEAAHKIPTKISDCKYINYKNLNGRHPTRITVVFNDGSVKNYRMD